MDPRRNAVQPGHPEHQQAPVTHSSAVGSRKPLSYRILAILLIVASLLGIGYMVTRAASSITADSAVKTKQYQALFLTNGQVYFGHLASIDSSYVKLNDIYYLQVQQTVQPKDQNAAANPQVSLAKLGGELHGPEDVMFVSRTQVLFWENLKNDGKVAQAIANYKSSTAATPAK